MTTIAFKDGIMAADSLATSDDFVASAQVQKLFRLPTGALLGVAGDSDTRDLVAFFSSLKKQDELPSRDTLANLRTDAAFLFARAKDKLLCGVIQQINGTWCAALYPRHQYSATGSGRDFAMGAMGFGASAVSAVKVAIKFDPSSGGRVRMLRLKD